MSRGAWAVAALLGASTAAAAGFDATSASPDAPAVELGWRGSLRAKAGVRIPFLAPKEGEAGVLLEVPAFIELHNAPGNGSIVPYELWRARIALGGGYRWRAGDLRVDVLALLEHESDHVTGPNLDTRSPDFGFVNFNDLAVSGRVRRAVRHPTFAQLTARLHLLTCTVSTRTCGQGLGWAGDRTVEVSAEASQELTLDEAARWALFASVAGDVMAATPLVAPARRVALRLGGLWRRPRDVLSLSLYGLAGTDVGYARGPDTLQLGVQFAWVLAD